MQHIAEKAATTEATQQKALKPYRLRAQLLQQGRTDTEMADSRLMNVRLKVYASGGENALHAHMSEDHTFLVLQGSARFYDENDVPTDVSRYGGMFVPAGAHYRFEATSAEELVMFRVGAKDPTFSGADRVNIRGQSMAGNSAENKTVQVVYKQGKFFE